MNDITVMGAIMQVLMSFLIVAVALAAVMVLVRVLAKAYKSAKPKKAAPAPAAAAAAPAAAPVPAPGTAGEIKLYDVPERQAAMAMAIVAHQLQKPLNELRFKSIKEVK